MSVSNFDKCAIETFSVVTMRHAGGRGIQEHSPLFTTFL